eukprot:CAMPEP_0119014670 /NCGR_PEP_ID=MMETSP1176-20130426/10160_1 /TAXON_ID=265551 /ORGANISM="Synedropsis recta cf, Strain CCMP1620" /LENGTH=368 /DNA_ID=CAMNT_0006967885 /DNA_START=50 /DNA_END=1156 /DNA_ORIENTATION=+
MGITFRYGGYARFVRIGGRTIKDGEAAVVWNNKGICTEIVGPNRTSLWFSTIRFLDPFKAEAQQYLAVKYRDGTVEHMPGPINLYLNPVVHDSIQVQDGTKLESKDDCIVVFSSRQESHAVGSPPVQKVARSARRVVYGPTFYFISPNDSIHQFKWSRHASVLNQPSPFINEFQALSTSKTNLWRIHCSIKTAESNTIQVGLAISYTIFSVEKCLAAHNPIELIEAALMHDAQHSIIGKEADSHEWIAKKSTFPTFCETMTSVGFLLLRIQVLDVEQSFRAKQEAIKEKRVAQAKDMSKIEQQVKAACQINDTKLDYLKSLNAMGVDVTQVLCASGGQVGWIGDEFGKSILVNKNNPRQADSLTLKLD